MAVSNSEKKPEVEVLVVVRELWGGDWVAFPAASPEHRCYGESEDDVLFEQERFLERYLGTLPAAEWHRFAVAPDAELVSAEVRVPRDDLPRQLRHLPPIALSCLRIPAGKNAAWIVVFALEHTFYVRDGRAQDARQPGGTGWRERAQGEIARIAAVREMTAQEYLQLLPGREERCERVRVAVRPPEDPAQTVSSPLDPAKGKRESEHRRLDAQKLLLEIGDPLREDQEERRRHPPEHHLVGRAAEENALRSLLLGKERLGVVVGGRELVGKTALIEKVLAQRAHVYVTSGARIMAGQSYLGQWQERMHDVLEAADTLDAILYFDNLADLFAERDGSDDIAGLLRPYLEERRVRLVGELHPEVLEEAALRHVGFFGHLHQLVLEPLDKKAALQALAERAQRDRRASREAAEKEGATPRPSFKSEAVEPLVNLAERYLPYRAFPGKAMRLYEEILAAHAHDVDAAGRPRPVGVNEVFAAVSRRTGIPDFLLREDRALRLERILEAFRRRIVGQEQAVRSVAETLCTVKAGLQPAGRPLAVFLFVGPTGVGKTEVARTLADFLFGSEDRLLRFDMSEYMDAWAAERLIRGRRAEAGGEDGLLTRAIRAQPFSVVLLDEVEKASPAVFDLLLQVLGEGRLSDARGRTAYFHNAIVIMTSNLGAAHRRDRPGFSGGESTDATASSEDRAYYLEKVEEHFRPEFVNRLDRIISFAALRPAEVEKIARQAVARIAERHGLAERGLSLEVADDVLVELARGAYDAAYGARQLHRHLDEHLVAPLGRLLGRLSFQAAGDGHLGTGILEVRLGAAAGDEVEHEGGLAFVVHRGQRRNSPARIIDEITAARRDAARWLANPRIAEIRDDVENLTTQLSRHRRRRGKKKDEAAPSVEIVRMSIDLHRLQEIWKRLDKARQEIEDIEELAIADYLESGKPDDSRAADDAEELFLGPLHEARRAFLQALPFALVAGETPRDAISLVLTECDPGRALDFWLLPLIDDARRREWSIAGHGIDGQSWNRKPWPADQLQKRLELAGPTHRRVLLRVQGPNAGIFLAAEAGLHCFQNAPLRDSAETADGNAFLNVVRLALRDSLDGDDLKVAAIECLGPLPKVRRKPSDAVRIFDFARRRLVAGRDRQVLELSLEEYWPRFEEIVLAHLKPYEDDPTLDRDADLLSAVL